VPLSVVRTPVGIRFCLYQAKPDTTGIYKMLARVRRIDNALKGTYSVFARTEQKNRLVQN
jgi:hypothetical protein